MITEPSNESSSDGQSSDGLADAILAAKPRATEPVKEALARLSVQPGTAGQERGGEPPARDGVPWSRVGRYQLLERLGRGAMGEVWVGLDTELGRKVALKQLRPRSAHHKDRLRREAQALARLSHPNVVTVYGVEKDHGQLFIAMELVEGHTLQQWQERRPAPTWSDCVQAYVQAGRGLAAAHAAGLVHRDFKPSNCMIDGQGRVKVLDFGLASRAKSDVEMSTKELVATSSADEEVDDVLSRSLTQTGTFVGTQAYMAPEALAGASISEHGDQFSFCVSLYEAVYGERPFEGSTRSGLVDAVMRGRVRPAPRASAVPSWLRRILLRGLEVDARRRWPSMDGLLVELGRPGVSRTKRWIALGVAGVGVVVGVALGWQRHAQHEKALSHCSAQSMQAADVWSRARQQEAQSAFDSVGSPYVGDTWTRVSEQLDGYAAQWGHGYEAACRDHLLEERDDEEWELQRECFRDRKMALSATVDVLVQADAHVVERAVGLVSSLPSLAECSEVERLRELRALVPLPNDSDAAAKVAALRERLTQVEVLQDAGSYRQALESVESLVIEAEALGYEPLRAEILHRRGSIRNDNGLSSGAERDLMDAFELAVEHRHDEVVFLASRSLAFILALNDSRYDEASIFGKVGLALAHRMHDDLALAKAFRAMAHVSFSEGDSVGAEANHRRALELLDGVEGVSPGLLAITLNDLGGVLSEQGRHEEAEPIQRRALRLWQDALGEDHPDVAMSLSNLGYAVEGQGRYQEAEEHYRRSLDIRERALGPDDQYVARSVESLASVLFKQGRYSEAEECYRRVLRIREQRASRSDDPNVALSLGNLGLVLRLRGQHEEAERYQLRSLRILDALLDEDHPQKLMPLVELAQLALVRGDLGSARMYAERAASIVESRAVAPFTVAGVQQALALVLWSDPAERRRARVAARRALDTYVHVGADAKSSLAEVAEWLDTHRQP